MSAPGSTGLLIGAEPEFGSGSGGADTDLIGWFLDDQSDLSAVDRFARFHDELDLKRPHDGRRYRALLPAGPPGPGEQLAFEVDLDRCSGCKACVTACHNLNGLDEGESWRDVGLLVGTQSGLPVLQHVTSACHHCLEPACLSACPVDAYEKDPVTGIVRHLDDQCFGCQYCTWACHYGAPKFHAAKGIVRKCDMCHERLAAGEAPACVQACPHEAIRIRVVDQADLAARREDGGRWPAMPHPGYALPATYYASGRVLGQESVVSAADHALVPEHTHWPLVVMTVLTQLSVGGFLTTAMAPATSGTNLVSLVSLAACWAGLAASMLHLGRPLLAYRALVGLKHSWLSREILAFGAFVVLASLKVALGLGGSIALPVVAAGVAGIVCSVMVYHVVRRPFWSAEHGAIRFGGTTLVLGVATALAARASAAVFARPDGIGTGAPVGFLALGLIASSAVKLCYELALPRRLARSERPVLRQSARLLEGPLAGPARLRRVFGVVGGVLLPALALACSYNRPALAAVAAVLALVFSLAGEIVERYLFFTAVVVPKAPGGLLPS
jgi:formate dehydrogenase iron-sulfur subunit